MSQKTLTLSIVIPAYNEEDHIGACLDAIAAQTVMPNEVIVVDNNSTDKTVEIAQKYPFVTVIQEKTRGIVYGRDAGFNAAHSQLIGRIDADTHLPRGWVAYALRFMEHHPEGILTGGSHFYDLHLPGFFGWLQGQLAFRANRFIMGYYITWGSNMMFWRHQWEAIRPTVCHDNAIHEDMDLAIHLHQKGYRITYHAGWKVGIDSRLHSRHGRSTHMKYLRMWPQTLRTHHFKRAWLGTVGAYAVYLSYLPLLCINWLAAKH